MSNKPNTNYVTIVEQPGGLFAWRRVIGERKMTSTTVFGSPLDASVVAHAIAQCNGIVFRQPVQLIS